MNPQRGLHKKSYGNNASTFIAGVNAAVLADVASVGLLVDIVTHIRVNLAILQATDVAQLFPCLSDLQFGLMVAKVFSQFIFLQSNAHTCAFSIENTFDLIIN